MKFFKSFLPKFLYNGGDQEPNPEFNEEAEKEKISNENRTEPKKIDQNDKLTIGLYQRTLSQQNYHQQKPKEVFVVIDQGNYGIQLFNQKKYKESKEILMKACDELMREYKQNQNVALREYLVKFLKYSEECHKILKVLHYFYHLNYCN